LVVKEARGVAPTVPRVVAPVVFTTRPRPPDVAAVTVPRVIALLPEDARVTAVPPVPARVTGLFVKVIAFTVVMVPA
jgi:hypothetical protein